MWTQTYVKNFITVLPVIIQTGNNEMPINNRKDKVWHIHTLDYFKTIKNKLLHAASESHRYNIEKSAHAIVHIGHLHQIKVKKKGFILFVKNIFYQVKILLWCVSYFFRHVCSTKTKPTKASLITFSQKVKRVMCIEY